MDSVDLIMKQYQAVADDSLNAEGLSMIHNLPTRISSSIREYLCYKAYLVMYSSEECVVLNSSCMLIHGDVLFTGKDFKTNHSFEFTWYNHMNHELCLKFL